MMTFLIASILVAAVAAFAIREAEPPAVHPVRERDAASAPGAGADAPVILVPDDSPLLQTTVVEPAGTSTQRWALAKLIGGIAASGMALGFAVVLLAKMLGILLRHFVQGS